MRKIEKEMIQNCARINRGADQHSWTKDNTHVSGQKGLVQVFLHGNHIASFVDGMLQVNLDTLRRWPSMTTRSRLRALGANLVSIKGALHLDGKSIYAE
jgi:hypothetical protein